MTNSFIIGSFLLQSLLLIQCLPVTFHGDEHRNGGEECDGPKFRPDVSDSITFQKNAADDAHEMSEWQYFPNCLRPAGHSAEWKGEAGKQQRRQKEKESHLHRLKLVLGNRGKRDAHGKICDDKKSGG